MCRPLIWIMFICLAVILLACQSATQPVVPQARSQFITPAQLPSQFDTSRTYVYRYSQAPADSLLTEMMKARLPLSRAWLPIDNLCMDPVGPRFTVELKRSDNRIFEFGFVRGVGRLACARQLKQFVFP